MEGRTLRSHKKVIKMLPSKFSMDLMPIAFGCSAGSSGQLHRGGRPSKSGNGSALEGESYSRMRLQCNQLDEHFSFENRERALRPLPLL
jgi:hypothetical protein